MDANRKCNMRRLVSYLAAAIAALLALSCSEQEIPVYDASNASVFFASKTTEFSLKSVSETVTDLKISLDMFGPVCDYDRQIKVELADSSWNDAVEYVDFTLVEALVPAGEMKGRIVLRVQNPEDLTSKTTTLAIIPDAVFPYIVKDHDYTKVHWSKEYIRPSKDIVWQTWFLFFSQGYSRRYHQLLIEKFGEEIERSSYKSSALKDPDCVYHVNSWWYSANRELYDYVKEHDKANPDSPLMHSEDYELYSSYAVAVGSGIKPETPPTILSTLNVL